MKSLQLTFIPVILLVILITNGRAVAEGMTGTLDTVIDGDLITILSKGKEVEVRLFGIDTPERTQPFGQNAKNFIGAQASDKELWVKTMRKDANGRTVGLVFANGVNLNEQLVGQGFAWVMRQECATESFCADWVLLETKAKGAKKGLWANANPAPPWEHRRNRPGSSEGKSLELTGMPSNPVTITPAGPAAYHGDAGSRIFHDAACKEFNCKKCTVKFQTITEALDAGYRPHRDCIGR